MTNMKPHMNESQLIDELVNNKRITRSTIPNNILKERAYTTIINPYKHFICTNYSPITRDYLYKENGDFKDYLIMAQLDDYLSTKLSIYINLFEKKLKAYLAETLAEKMKDTSPTCNDYSEFNTLKTCFPSNNNLKSSCTSPISPCHNRCYDLLHIDEMYDSSLNIIPADRNIIKNRQRALDSLLKNSNIIADTNNLLIKHYYVSGICPPIWIAVHNLTLGDILALFNMLNKADRLPFCQQVFHKKRIRNKSIAKLSARIEIIRTLRNTINHYEPLLPYIINFLNLGQEAALYRVIELLKNNYTKSATSNIVIKRKKILGEVERNNYNKKYLDFLEQILSIS